MLSPRVRRHLARLGWAYVIYHALIVALLVAVGIHDPGRRYFSRLDSDTVFVVLAYPAFVPGLAVCGGLHDHCDTVVGRAIELVVFAAAGDRDAR
jgi:hypothetical protein